MDGAAPQVHRRPSPSPAPRRPPSPRLVFLIGAVAALVVVGVAVTLLVANSSDDRVTFVKPDPGRIVFDPAGPRDALVTIRNTSATTTVVLQEPAVTGPGRAAFSVRRGSCQDALGPGRTCEMAVRFEPLRSGTYIASVAVPTDKGRAPDVELVGDAQF